MFHPSGNEGSTRSIEAAVARGRVKVFFDGGSRPNPGPMEAAVVIRGTVHLFDDLGVGTNNDAEWLALIRALELAQLLGLERPELIGDALPVIRQANLVLANPEAAGTSLSIDTFLGLAAAVSPSRIRWIKREQNLAGIALAARHPR